MFVLIFHTCSIINETVTHCSKRYAIRLTVLQRSFRSLGKTFWNKWVHREHRAKETREHVNDSHRTVLFALWLAFQLSEYLITYLFPLIITLILRVTFSVQLVYHISMRIVVIWEVNILSTVNFCYDTIHLWPLRFDVSDWSFFCFALMTERKKNKIKRCSNLNS